MVSAEAVQEEGYLLNIKAAGAMYRMRSWKPAHKETR